MSPFLLTQTTYQLRPAQVLASVRLSLYRRLADLETDEEIDNFAAEMRDLLRFA